jgi:predicted glycoside hydrolase/deacetylase ChbG (UPF0249 family)
MNLLLKRLGFGPTDRVAIIHADDFGMCQATIPAVAELFDAGLLSSASIMLPCPWSLAAADYCRTHPLADVGVHTTLTAEWSQYRWRPLSTREPDSGMLDAAGFFPHSCAELWAHADPAAVAGELAMQLDSALALGIDVTHLDSHMGAVFDPPLLPSYLTLGISQQLPTMFPRLTEALLRALGIAGEGATALQAQQAAHEQHGAVLVDAVIGMPLERSEDRIGEAQRLFETLPIGLTHFILHPAIDTPELRAIAPDWKGRVADYEAFCSTALREYVRNSGIQVIGYRAIRDAIQQG